MLLSADCGQCLRTVRLRRAAGSDRRREERPGAFPSEGCLPGRRECRSRFSIRAGRSSEPGECIRRFAVKLSAMQACGRRTRTGGGNKLRPAAIRDRVDPVMHATNSTSSKTPRFHEILREFVAFFLQNELCGAAEGAERVHRDYPRCVDLNRHGPLQQTHRDNQPRRSL